MHTGRGRTRQERDDRSLRETDHRRDERGHAGAREGGSERAEVGHRKRRLDRGILPNRSLEPSNLPLTVDLGAIQAVIESYPGHTPSDLIVRVPQQNIIFTGTFCSTACTRPLRMRTEQLAKDARDVFGLRQRTLFVPGHGPCAVRKGSPPCVPCSTIWLINL